MRAQSGSRGIATARPLYAQEWPVAHCIGSWVGPKAGLDGCGKSWPHQNFDSRTVQTVASRYTNWTIPVHSFLYYQCHFKTSYLILFLCGSALNNCNSSVLRKMANWYRSGKQYRQKLSKPLYRHKHKALIDSALQQHAHARAHTHTRTRAHTHATFNVML
jgi:hypothetical protein